MIKYINKISNKLHRSMSNIVNHKKLHKSHKQWIVIGMSALVMLTGPFALSASIHASNININKNIATKPKINNNNQKDSSKATTDGIQARAKHFHNHIINNQLNNKIIRIGSSHAKQYFHSKNKNKRMKLNKKSVNKKHFSKRHINRRVYHHVTNDYIKATKAPNTNSDNNKTYNRTYNLFQRKFKSGAHNKHFVKGVEFGYLDNKLNNDNQNYEMSNFSSPTKYAQAEAKFYAKGMKKFRRLFQHDRKELFNRSFNNGYYTLALFNNLLDNSGSYTYKEDLHDFKSNVILGGDLKIMRNIANHKPSYKTVSWRTEARQWLGYGLKYHQLYMRRYKDAKKAFKHADPNDYYENIPSSKVHRNNQQLPKALINSINKARYKDGVSRLSENSGLDKVAAMRAKQMYKDNSYGYDSNQTKQDAKQQGITLSNNWTELINNSTASKNLFMNRNNYMNANGIADKTVNTDLSLGKDVYGADNDDKQAYQQAKQILLNSNYNQIGTGAYYDKEDQLFYFVEEFE